MIAAAISSLILEQLHWNQEHTPENLNTGISSIDNLIEGCPRGRITEVVGPVSSGRSSLLLSILAEATRLDEFCAVVDTMNAFDPAPAEAAGFNLRRLVWVRCNGNAEHAMKSADLLVHSGGFGIISLDLCEVPASITRRIPLSWWYRFRRAIENTPTVLLVLQNEPNAKACASLLLEMKRDDTAFTGTQPFQIFEHARFEALPRKPVCPVPARFEARAFK